LHSACETEQQLKKKQHSAGRRIDCEVHDEDGKVREMQTEPNYSSRVSNIVQAHNQKVCKRIKICTSKLHEEKRSYVDAMPSGAIKQPTNSENNTLKKQRNWKSKIC